MWDGAELGRFKRGIFNVIHDLRVRAKMAQGVSSSLQRRVANGLKTGRPRRGEAVEDERYAGLDAAGKQVLAGYREGMTIRELGKLTGWPKSSVYNFLKRNKWRLEK